MTKREIIFEVKKIILKYANPTRIYLYGSQANGENRKGSDIDIAFEDENFKDDYLIKDEVEKLKTLIKIDVKNIAKKEDRFKNRVKATGKVIYSANKRLRAEDGLYNFTSALKRFISAIEAEKELKEEGFGDFYLDLIVKRFEFTYEMSWKALKRYLEYLGFEIKNPRSAFKEGYAQGLLDSEEVWLDMIEQRNISSHIYDEYEVEQILEKLEKYKDAFVNLKERLKNGLDDNV